MSYAQWDDDGNMVDVGGNIVVPSHVVQQYVSALQQQGHQPQFRAANEFAQFEIPRQLLGITRHQPLLAAQPQSPSPSSRSQTGESLGECLSRPSGPPGRPTTRPTTDQQAGDRGAAPHPGLARARTNSHSHSNAYGKAAALPAASSPGNASVRTSAPAVRASPNTGWLPQVQNLSPGFDNSADTPAAWLPAQPANEHAALVYDHSHISPPLSQNPAPSIRVTTDFAGASLDFSQPQDAIYSASSPASSLPPDAYHPYNSSYTDHLSPHRSFHMPQEGDNMQTPVSPVSGHNSPHEAAMAAEQQMTRKRSHSIMSQQDTQPQPYPVAVQQQYHSRDGSVVSGPVASPHDHFDELPYSPRGSRAFKRGDPPKNAHDKFICEFAEECAGLIFDRKCEWSKHMDKHDRPYRCPHPSCAKLQGFTYSGGLLRHEREVHGKHGGPKSQLMCPHTDCKRHSGKGFTRKENLNEHLRRVHPKDGIPHDSQMSQVSMLSRDHTGLDGEDGDAPASQAADHDNFAGNSPVLGKRKRTLQEVLGGSGVLDDRDEEIKRLRAELEFERNERHRLENDTLSYQEDIRRLQANLMQSHAHEESQQSRGPQQETAQV